MRFLRALWLVIVISVFSIHAAQAQCGGVCAHDGPRLSVALGTLSRGGGTEAYLRYESDRKIGPFDFAAGMSISEHGALWIGAGLMWTRFFPGSRVYVQANAMPGLYHRGNGPDLGHPLEFRTGLELGYAFDRGARISLGLDHRSNAHIGRWNPGINGLFLRVSMPLR